MKVMKSSIKTRYVGDGQYELQENVVINLSSIWDMYSFDSEDVVLKEGRLLLRMGFRFNGSTFVGDTSETLMAALVHDAKYTILAELGANFFDRYRLRKSADKVYAGDMLASDAKIWRVVVRFVGLRTFGGIRMMFI